jgi:hypothetical protein
MSENVGASTSRKPKGLHGLYRENFTFTVTYPKQIEIKAIEVTMLKRKHLEIHALHTTMPWEHF